MKDTLIIPKNIIENLSNQLDINPPSFDVQNNQLMTWDHLIEVNNNGINIGSHSHSHRVLSTLNINEQEIEIIKSKNILEHKLNTNIKSISYPIGNHGSFTNETKIMVKNAGYEIAFSFLSGFHRYAINDPYEIRRISPYENFDLFKMSILQPNLFLYK